MGLLAGLLLIGCGRQKEEAVSSEQPAAPTSPASGSPPAPAPVTADPRLHQPFATAVITDPPPPDQRLPETTLTGKSVGKLYLEVEKIWDQIRFVSPTGKPLAYRAILDTEVGQIEIALRPDWAPNHVRSFLALAQVGYYDGLVFERTVHEESEAQPDAKVDLIEAGCPTGTGDQGYGSIGYWLRRECETPIAHEEGSVGACHSEDPDTAACKFYITLCKAPVMDGEFTIFGKVVRGLDVAHKIFSQPVRNDPSYPEGDRPQKPLVIRKVTIQTQEVDSAAAKGQN
jgi:cyclophilin family peptidyl-prolyl cis-trans isomerase